jgi:cyclic dehypoxanthinyl futalosine synthase
MVTFVVDSNINHTNVCITNCSFCAFYRPPGHDEAYTRSHEQILRMVGEMADQGGTELLMQGGHNPDLTVEYFETLFREIKRRYPQVVIHSLSPSEIQYISRRSKLTIYDTMVRLKEAGWQSFPGGGAEILVDRVRDVIAPLKTKSQEWLDIMRTAHNLGVHGSTTMMFGHVETLEERVEHLQKLRDLQDETHGWRAFICWTYQPGNTELNGREVGSFEYLRTLAFSRLFLDNVPNMQASWLTQGLKVGQVALSFGANDLGGTLIEEEVVRSTGITNKSNAEVLVKLIREVGKTPALRNTLYEIVKVY